MTTTLNIDRLVAAYVRLRDEKKAQDDAHKEAQRPLVEKMEKLEAALQKLMLDQGVRSLRTAHGTPYLQERVSLKVTDWEASLQDIIEGSKWDLLERRINKTAFEERLAQGDTIDGVERVVDLKTNVRRA